MNIIKTKLGSLILLDVPIIESYYDVLKKYSYYFSIPNASLRRDFSEEVVLTFEKFISLYEDDDNKLYIDEILINESKVNHDTESNLGPVSIAQIDNPEGYLLLEIEDDKFDFDSLKKCYRNASKKHHPDKGGDTEKMKIINEAFQSFNKILTLDQQLKSLKNDKVNEVIKSEKYVIKILLTLINIYQDLWDLDKALYWYKYINCNFLPDFFIENDYSTNFSNFELFYSLSKRLSTSKYLKEASDLYFILKENFFQRSSSDYDFEINHLEKLINGEKKFNKIFNHIIQARNANKLGIIDELKYDELKDKLDSKNNISINKHEILKEYLALNDFSILPIDSSINIILDSQKFVAFPSYFNGDFENELSVEQRSEYYKVFKSSKDPEKIFKYVYVRFDRILRSIIFNYNDLNIDQIILELNVLSKTFAIESNSIEKIFNNIHQIIHHLNSLSESERSKKLELLKRLNEKAISRDSSEHYQISLRFEYKEVAFLSIQELEKLIETGFFESFEEIKVKSKEWKDDLVKIQNFNKLKINEEVWDLLIKEKKNYQKIADTLEVYCNIELDLFASLNFKENLDISYMINEYTIALGKIKEGKKAYVCLENFFDLERKYELKTSRDIRNQLIKRFHRFQR